MSAYANSAPITLSPIPLSPKYVSGAFPYGIDFRLQLANSATPGDALSTVTSITASVLSGSDPSPQLILNGSPQISGTQVLQQIVGGVAGTQYLVEIVVRTVQGNTLVGQFSFWVQAW